MWETRRSENTSPPCSPLRALVSFVGGAVLRRRNGWRGVKACQRADVDVTGEEASGWPGELITE